ncbi:MAG: hypothetical protein CW338_11365 [Clostridiales bacterium]|nr:hypothetical protein [Clostridiales bacterium]
MKQTKLFCVRIILLILAACFIPCMVSAEEAPVRMYCLNVGKADCIILQAYGRNYLIDTGSEQNYPALQNALQELNIVRLDGVFLTHTDSDHAGGLLKLSMSGMEVSKWYASAIYYEYTEEKHPLRLAAAIRGKDVVWLYASDVISVSEQASLAVLGPVKVNAGNENNNSLVLRFDSPDGSILLTGDMKSEEEASLISAKVLSHADVLKVGHHGDGNATSAAFIQIVKPEIAVISTSSALESDTPDKYTLERIRSSGCSKCAVTQDFDDAVMISLCGGEVSVQNVIWSSVPGRVKCISMRLDAESDRLILYNNSSDPVVLDGYILYAVQNGKSFKLKDVCVSPYSFYVIGSSKTEKEVDYRLSGTKRIWSKNKNDAAILYDMYGRITAAANNGIKE